MTEKQYLDKLFELRLQLNILFVMLENTQNSSKNHKVYLEDIKITENKINKLKKKYDGRKIM